MSRQKPPARIETFIRWIHFGRKCTFSVSLTPSPKDRGGRGERGNAVAGPSSLSPSRQRGRRFSTCPHWLPDGCPRAAVCDTDSWGGGIAVSRQSSHRREGEYPLLRFQVVYYSGLSELRGKFCKLITSVNVTKLSPPDSPAFCQVGWADSLMASV